MKLHPRFLAGRSIRSRHYAGGADRGLRLGPARLLAILLLLAIGISHAAAADITEAIAAYRSGKYDEALSLTAEAIEAGRESEEWHHVRIESQMAIGRYAEAQWSLAVALERFPTSIRLRWIGVDVQRFNGDAPRAEESLAEIGDLLDKSGWRYRDAANQIAAGWYYLHRGADAKAVLNDYFNKVKRTAPRLPHGFIAAGELALEKNDYGLAAKAFEEAAKLSPNDPDVQFGVARAFAESDAKRSHAALDEALKLNPRHVPSLLRKVDEHVSEEQYDEADEAIERVLEVNPEDPTAWAYRAVLAHLRGDAEYEVAARARALSHWQDNPEIDHLIGRELSQNYRFAEGATYQRLALGIDADFLPAQLQLAQDLLRLGDEDGGWQLADAVFERNNYDVVAHNLATLRDRLTKFATLEGHGFVVRMEAQEAAVYGERVLALLGQAKRELCAKYDVKLDEPTFVEIFPRQQDFAIRTFGVPTEAGFLGVCFGRVITMNSPASQGEHPANWQAVVWHEFCHVVTLAKTNNKMPRWLSEGISVYEERQANPAWGQSMNPEYRAMVLGGLLTPVSRLSRAFLDAQSPLHIQFAYYESSLVVEYIVEKHGLDTLKHVLDDLGQGVSINAALARRVGSLEELDGGFAAYARKRAENLAPKADLDEPDAETKADPEALAKWIEEHPNGYFGLRRLAARLMAEKKWAEAKATLMKVRDLYPEYGGGDSAYVLLAMVHRELGETAEEIAALAMQAKLDADALPSCLRLLELCSAAEDWEAVAQYAEAAIAINPLVTAPHRHLATAAEKLGDDERTLYGLKAQLTMDALDLADAHFRIAKAYRRQRNLVSARRHVLQALEEAPRYRDAQRLLVELVAAMRPPREPEPDVAPDVATEAAPDKAPVAPEPDFVKLPVADDAAAIVESEAAP
ncbi:MAG: tetratricopeptide repeat protein [Pirellulales bacterium]